jgi:hypothetical protein
MVNARGVSDTADLKASDMSDSPKLLINHRSMYEKDIIETTRCNL